jgi:hypothetical protein
MGLRRSEVSDMTGSPETPKEAFQRYLNMPFAGPDRPDLAAVNDLRSIAEAWIADQQYFSAGYALYRAIDFAWGDIGAINECFIASLNALATGAESTSQLPRLGCLWMLRVVLDQNYGDLEVANVGLATRALDAELAQLLLELGEAADDANKRAAYLVRGFHLLTDWEGTWTPEFPDFEIRGTGMGWGSEAIRLTIQSAFHRFVSMSDYAAADQVADSCPDAFISPGLRGWRAAVRGSLNSDHAVQYFREAATEFASDVHHENPQPFESWSSINIDLWATYFEARALVAEIAQASSRADELVHAAREVLGPARSGWNSAQVRSFRLILYVLDQILNGADPDSAAIEARRAIVNASMYVWDETHEQAIAFFDSVAEAFDEIRRDPSLAWTSGRLQSALAALGRIPLIGEAIADAVSPAMGESAQALLNRLDNIWIQRTIESIENEQQLQKVLLRLFEAQLPLYAQIRHGNQEFGKDIVVLRLSRSEVVLEMYQVKAGTITLPVWRNASHELEEMFLVDIPSLQLPAEPNSRVGVLIFNGHFNEFSERVAEGWLRDQKRYHDRSFRFMHINDIVNWILRNGLVSALRRALAEFGIGIID